MGPSSRKEDILLRRVKVSKKRRSNGHNRTELPLQADEQAAVLEAEALAAELAVPVNEAARILADDRESYIPPPSIATATANKGEEGDLYTKGTVDAYIAAAIELRRVQVAHGGKNTDNPRGAVDRGFLEQRGRQRNQLNRVSFKDRGTQGI